MDMNKL